MSARTIKRLNSPHPPGEFYPLTYHYKEKPIPDYCSRKYSITHNPIIRYLHIKIARYQLALRTTFNRHPPSINHHHHHHNLTKPRSHSPPPFHHHPPLPSRIHEFLTFKNSRACAISLYLLNSKSNHTSTSCDPHEELTFSLPFPTLPSPHISPTADPAPSIDTLR